jgi:CheY-like chemotaxis protein
MMPMIHSKDLIHLLLVEDNEGDILLTTEAFEEGQIIHQLSVVRDGESAIDFLEKRGRYASVNSPDLILLDINLPKKNGHEVLQYIKQHDQLRTLPVIILSTSSSEKDIYQSYHQYASCFITKPANIEGFQKVMVQIEDFWLSIVKLPIERKEKH